MEGSSKKKGSIRHCMKVHKHLKSEMGKPTVMKRIRAADTEALKVLRKKHDRETLKANRNSKKRKAATVEDSDEEDEEMVNDLDD